MFTRLSPATSLRTSRLVVGVTALAAAVACGRSTPRSDAGVGGPRPCRPTCDQICQAQVSCDVIVSRAACLSTCTLDSTQPAYLCIGQQICNDTLTCDAVISCTLNPKVPDLTISFTPYSPGPGRIDHDALVCNTGTGDAPVTSVQFYRHRSSPPAAGEAGDLMARLPALLAGNCTAVSTSDTGVAGGTYQAWAQVDVEGAVLEAYEDNNVAGPVPVKVSGAGQLPDLVITSLSGLSGPNGVDYSVMVCNSGGAASAATLVELYPDRAGAPDVGEMGKLSATVPSLKIGACVTVGFYSVPLGDGTHQGWARVDRADVVAESNEANNLYGPVTVYVGAGTKPDLAISSFKASVASSGSVTFVAQICNQGKGSASATSLDLYTNRTKAPTPSDVGDKSTKIAALGPGSCTGAAFTVSLGPGTYQSWLYVDRLNAVAESNESNNAATTTFTMPGAAVDLALTKLTYTISPTGAGPVTYVATVCNNGKTTAPSTTLNLYYNLASAPSTTTPADKSATIPSLAAGLCTSLAQTATLSPGTYKSWGWVDPGNKVAETNESNNVVSTTVTVGKAQADLSVSSFTHSVSPATGTVYYYVTVCNSGTASSSSTNLEIYYDSASAPPPTTAGNQSSAIQLLGAGGCTSRSFTATLSPGTRSSWAWVDRTNVVAESNEANNVKGPLSVTVGGTTGPDLVVSSFKASPPSGSGPTLYDVVVCNKGTSTAPSTTVQLYYNLSAAPKPGQLGDTSGKVPALTAGLCVALGLPVTLPPGAYSSWAYVDATGLVAESNETNNVAGPTSFTVGTPLLPDLKISKLGVQVAGSTATYSIDVCNGGAVSSTSCYVGVYYNLAAAPKPPSTVANGSVYIGPIAPGACFSASWIATLADGAYSSWAYVDTSFMVAESDEANNVGGPTSFAVGTQGCADVCAILVSPCGLISQSQLQTCASTCAAQPQPKLDCAVKAATAQPPACYDIITCLFS